MTVLHHAFSALMARVPHRKHLSHGREGKPTGTDKRWYGQNNARPHGTEAAGGHSGWSGARTGYDHGEEQWSAAVQGMHDLW
jgi:hypothetical protein